MVSPATSMSASACRLATIRSGHAEVFVSPVSRSVWSKSPRIFRSECRYGACCRAPCSFTNTPLVAQRVLMGQCPHDGSRLVQTSAPKSIAARSWCLPSSAAKASRISISSVSLPRRPSQRSATRRMFTSSANAGLWLLCASTAAAIHGPTPGRSPRCSGQPSLLMILALRCRSRARRGYPKRPQAATLSSCPALAHASGVGYRLVKRVQCVTALPIWVWVAITSPTSTCQRLAPSLHGMWCRPFTWYQAARSSVSTPLLRFSVLLGIKRLVCRL